MRQLSGDLKEEIKALKEIFKDNSDISFRDIKTKDIEISCIYYKSVVDVKALGELILKPLLEVEEFPKSDLINHIVQNVLSFPDIEKSNTLDVLIENITKGKAVMLISGQTEALILGVDKFQTRALAEPPTSTVLRGPRRGFVESAKSNLSCIKEIIATPDLKTISLQVGRLTKTDVFIVYISSVCDKKMVNTIERKIKQIDIDGVIDSYYIASFLEVKPDSIFKQVGNSEKPDVVSAKLLEGRVAIIVNGSPIVLTLPFMLFEDFQSGDDYYSNNIKASIIRVVRMLSVLVTLILPGLYVAVQLYHYKLIPLTLIITLIDTTLGLPLSPFLEMLFVLLLFEILYEASLRMPKYLGIAVSIVGALILGDTAISAGIVSPPAVMIVALSGITLYTVPDQASQFIILRFIFTLLGGALGMYGMIIFSIYLITYLCDLDIYGTPYLSPFSPNYNSDFKDAIFKKDIVHMEKRPESIRNKNSRRMKK